MHPPLPHAEALLKRLHLEAFQDVGHSGLDVIDRLEVDSFDDALNFWKSQNSQGARSGE